MGAFHQGIPAEKITMIVVDLFCGGGGVSEGFHQARNKFGDRIAYVAVAVNHSLIAIESHAANHPETLHIQEDIWLANVDTIADAVRRAQHKFPNAVVVIWMSAECTHYSKAKGGDSRDPKSRTLPESIFRYLDAVNPDYLYVENVVEFMSWGPLVPKIVRHRDGTSFCVIKPNKKDGGRLTAVMVPESRTKGRYYIKWVHDIESRGYRYDYRVLNCANFGCHTSRERYFGIFAKRGLPVLFPDATHAPLKTVNAPLFSGHLEPWKPVREVLDLKDEGTSIFERETPLVEATLERILAGLHKFVGEKSFMTKYFSGHPGSKNYSLNGPAHSVTCIPHDAIVFLQSYYGNGNVSGSNEPAPTVTTHDRFGVVTVKRTVKRWIDRNFTRGGNLGSVDAPAGALLCIPKMNLVTVEFRTPWIMNTQYKNIGASVYAPAQTITADRHWHYLLNPQYKNEGNSIDRPAPTIIARQDKRPIQLVSVATCGADHSMPQPGDSATTLKIRDFMRKAGLRDIKMRMLKIPELKLITGFPEDYILKGSKAQQKEMIGNAVPVGISRAFAESLDEAVVSVLAI